MSLPSEVRVLGATALFTAALVFLAWWLGQHHDDIAQRLHGDETVTVGALPQLRLPSFSWGNDTPRALPAMTPDAGLNGADASLDAGADDTMTGTEAELAAILIPAICNRRRNECLCKEYPSRFAPEEERVGATTCEQDTLRDYRIWWRNNIRGPVVVVPEPELSSLLYDLIGCSGFHGHIGRFLRADAVVSERCNPGEYVRECQDGSPCIEGFCFRFQQVGESCWMEGDALPVDDDWTGMDCADRLRCVDHRCEVDPERTWRPVSPRPCRRGTHTLVISRDPLVVECLPNLTPCTQQNQCGGGYCAGQVREHRCVADASRTEDPGDHRGWSCGRTQCPRGHACQHRMAGTVGRSVCVPVVGEGEPCDEAICGQGTRCEWVVPGGGQCIAYSCLTSHTFGRVEREPEVEPDPEL